MKDISYYSDLLKIDLSEEQIKSFDTYMHMVIEKNKVMNLTAITDPEEFALKHFADSLSLISAAPEAAAISKETVSVIDVGTGAGFPGVPLKLAFPNVKLTLLDSLNKRITFLNEVVDKLQLDNVTTLHARAEEGGRNPKLRDLNMGDFNNDMAHIQKLIKEIKHYGCPDYMKTYFSKFVEIYKNIPKPILISN